jgi:hypothetical protein
MLRRKECDYFDMNQAVEAEDDREDAVLSVPEDKQLKAFADKFATLRSAISWRRTSVDDAQSSHPIDETVFVRAPSGNSSPSRV